MNPFDLFIKKFLLWSDLQNILCPSRETKERCYKKVSNHPMDPDRGVYWDFRSFPPPPPPTFEINFFPHSVEWVYFFEEYANPSVANSVLRVFFFIRILYKYKKGNCIRYIFLFIKQIQLGMKNFVRPRSLSTIYIVSYYINICRHINNCCICNFLWAPILK